MDTAWLDWVIELQALAQAGLRYSTDVYDLERFERVREIAAEMMSQASGLPRDVVKGLFCNESGYQTPKLDTRAAIFRDHKILLVKEKSTSTWALPGGWVDINETVRSNTVKEVREEAGLEVIPLRLIAVQDRNQHNSPRFAYNICKLFVLCEIISGQFTPNSETSESGFFGMDELPELTEDKTTEDQVFMCFRAFEDQGWVVPFD